ncbi:hypothetical protein CP965_00740 [Halarcobacter mediterraneus]|uniref:Double Cache domain-containing protein n=1 Tax=Halarcobacter mediterraneus TaxID=2023153 RepID=A0A4Q1AWB6_9BACT|nr:cache domain-containing protein [Halarcobacter mediterraneus]RXK14008.1 hypothetical protein CP965_00740 [Halarcobacter mediterraneus]
MSYLNSKTNKYLFIIVLLTSFFIVFIFYFLNNINNSNELLSKLENSLSTTKNLFEEQKRYALSLAILLSEDKEIINSYLKSNREESFKIVNKKIETLKQFQNSNFEIQIHNKDLTTYLRSWNLDIKDIPLASFRNGLVKVKKEKKPLVSIELGKRLNIKAISPILQDNKFLGSIEAIVDFEYLSEELKEKGYKLFVLLDEKYLSIATDLKNNNTISKFVLVNNANIFDLKDLDLNNLKDYGYTSNENYSFAYFSYYDLNHKHLGYIFTAIENNHHIDIKNSFDYEATNLNSKVRIK